MYEFAVFACLHQSSIVPSIKFILTGVSMMTLNASRYNKSNMWYFPALSIFCIKFTIKPYDAKYRINSRNIFSFEVSFYAQAVVRSMIFTVWYLHFICGNSLRSYTQYIKLGYIFLDILGDEVCKWVIVLGNIWQMVTGRSPNIFKRILVPLQFDKLDVVNIRSSNKNCWPVKNTCNIFQSFIRHSSFL